MLTTSRYARLTVAALAMLVAACDGPSDPDPVFGSLQLSIAGLPETVHPSIALTGPGGFSAQVNGPRTFTNLVPGTYMIVASQVVTSTATFAPVSQSQVIDVGANAVSQSTVVFSVTTGSIALVVSGGPPDLPRKVIVTGPSGYRDSASTSVTLGNLVPGIYSISAAEAVKGLSVYAGKPAAFVVSVNASTTPSPAMVGYILITGTLALHVNGLPSGVNGSITISGPDGFTANQASSVTLEGLRQGRYDITASSVGSGAELRLPSPATQSATVIAGSVGAVNVGYWAPNQSGLNLGIDALQVQQVVQTYGGSVPLVAGRAALLRVFVRASEANGASPTVRARLYDGAQEIATYSIPAPASGVPTAIDEGALSSSWNIPVPGSMIRPGLRIIAEVDPENVVVESVEGDNTWPSSGTPLPLDVRAVPPLTVHLVPVTQSTTGLTGNVTSANRNQYFAEAQRLLPVDVLTMDVRPAYTTNAPPLQPGDGNGAWVQLLSELNALAAAEGTGAHYYGVVKTPYTTGLAGISYLPSKVAIGWDTLPHAAPTMVHELGHNFGRLHSRSCGAGGVDAQYPYENGSIGVYGYDVSSGVLFAPAAPDIMGYCNGRWISDYTYAGIFSFRSALPNVVAAAVKNDAQPGLLVWGRISESGPVLEPAFVVNAPAKLPAGGGPHRIELLDESGKLLLALSFRGDHTVDAPRGVDEHFAFVIPLEALQGNAAARLRLVTSGLAAELASVGSTDFAPVVQRGAPGRARVAWRHAPGRGVLVRDAATGAILSFARGGRVDVRTNATQLDLTFSDGVRSHHRSVIVR